LHLLNGNINANAPFPAEVLVALRCPPSPQQQQLQAAAAAAMERGEPLRMTPPRGSYHSSLMLVVVMFLARSGTQRLLHMLDHVAQVPSSPTSSVSLVHTVSTLQLAVDNPAVEVLQRMAEGLDPEGRFVLMNTIANQLRYPSNHTFFFTCVVHCLFYLSLQRGHSGITEIITRVLLERLIAHRPVPWGLIVCFVELLKNPRYKLRHQPFTWCAEPIERLFETVVRSCEPAAHTTAPPMHPPGAGPQQVQQQQGQQQQGPTAAAAP